MHVLFPFVVGLGLAALGWRAGRSVLPHLALLAPMVAGYGVLGIFVVLRVALFSHLTRVLGWAWLESEATVLLELACVVLVSGGAVWAARELSTRSGGPDDRRT
jgi:hypothetical protein